MSKLVYILCLTIVNCLVTNILGETIYTDNSSKLTRTSKKNPGMQLNNKDNHGTKDTTIWRNRIKYLDFVNHTLMHLHLIDKVEESTYSISKKEIDKKLASYALLFPGVSIDTNLIRKEIAIERHLAKTGDYYVDNDQIKNAYEEYVESLPKGTLPPSFNEVKPVLMSRELFKNEDVISRSSHEKRIKEIKIYEKRAAAMETWPVEEIRLHGRDEECIAFLVDNDSCLITIGDFNKALPFNTMRKLIDKDTARIRIVEKILRNKYLVQKAYASDLDNNENLMHDIKHREENKILTMAVMKMGRPVFKEEILWETYKNNYHDLFKGYDKVTLQIIGSSDSLWIDSLSKLILQSIKTDTINKSTEIKKSIDEENTLVNNIPWIESEESTLPEILIIPTDTLPEKGITPVIMTPFGYFICRVSKVENVKSLTFKEARNQCVYIATRERYVKMDSLMDIKAFDYYKINKDIFITPDTMILRTWLIPLRKTKTSIHSDTVAFKSLTMNSLSLPQEVLKELTKLVKSEKNKNSFYGPLKSIYGTWYFKVDSIKSGGLQIPFQVVKHAIIDSIAKPHLQIEMPELDKSLQGVKYEPLLAKAYIRHDIQKIEELSDEEIHTLIEREIIDISDLDKGMSKRKIANYARDKYHEKVHNKREENIKKWMASIAIDRNKVLE